MIECKQTPRQSISEIIVYILYSISLATVLLAFAYFNTIRLSIEEKNALSF